MDRNRSTFPRGPKAAASLACAIVLASCASIRNETASPAPSCRWSDHEMELADGVRLESWACLSSGLQDAEREPARVVVLVHDFVVEGKIVTQACLQKIVGPDSTEPVRSSVTIVPPRPDPSAPDLAASVYTIEVSPLPGRTWVEVSDFGDLDVRLCSVEPARCGAH